MPKITKFDRNSTERLRADLNAYLKPFLEERGLTLELGNAKYNDGTVRFVGPEFKVPEVAQAKDNSRLRTMLQMHGIVIPGDPREVFESAEYVLTGYRPKASVRPWEARSKLDGKNYILTDASARLHFGTKK